MKCDKTQAVYSNIYDDYCHFYYKVITKKNPTQGNFQICSFLDDQPLNKKNVIFVSQCSMHLTQDRNTLHNFYKQDFHRYNTNDKFKNNISTLILQVMGKKTKRKLRNK